MSREEIRRMSIYFYTKGRVRIIGRIQNQMTIDQTSFVRVQIVVVQKPVEREASFFFPLA